MSDLDKLKDLLFGAEKQVLDSISKRVETRESRSVDVADILPEAIHSSHKSGPELTEALRQPVGQCLQKEFHEDPQTYSDALYPVIGPAIRKSIMHALRNFSQQINAAVEQSLTPRGLAWRFQAWRAGVPFGEFVVQKTLLYRVEQAYLISRENGLLVGHAQHVDAKIKDSDAVSAMFTAIQDFVKESFSPDRTGRLESADMGEFTLWAVHGPHALLVCVIRGVPPRQLRTELAAILERIHFRYGDAIRSYTGETASVPDVEEDLEKCLRLEAKQEPTEQKKKLPWPLLLFVLGLAIATIWYLVLDSARERELARLTTALERTPGIIVTDARVDDGRYYIDGLRDPEAPAVVSVAMEAIDRPGAVVASMRPFHSLEPELIAARAARLLDPPDSVTLFVEDNVLVASGTASLEWQTNAQAAYRTLAGIDSIDLRLSDDSGAVPARDAELARLAAVAERLNGAQFFFTTGAELTAQDAAALNAYVVEVAGLANALAAEDHATQVSVTGFADATGTPDVNQAVAQSRALVVAAALSAAGVHGEIATNWVFTTDAASPGVNPQQRRATVEVQIVQTSPSQ